MATRQIQNPNGAFGVTDEDAKAGGNTVEVLTSAAVSAKRVVAMGTDFKVATAATDGTPSLTVGISLNAIASGGTGQVVVIGPVANVAADGTIARGDLLKRSVNTAGYVAATATPAAGEVIGVALNASASNVVDVWVAPSKGLS